MAWGKVFIVLYNMLNDTFLSGSRNPQQRQDSHLSHKWMSQGCLWLLSGMLADYEEICLH